jgi:hypothetical protein
VRLDERKSGFRHHQARDPTLRPSSGLVALKFYCQGKKRGRPLSHHAKHLGNFGYNRGIFNAATHVEAIRNAQGEWRAEADGTGREERLRTVPGLHFGRPRPAASDYRGRSRRGGRVEIFQVHDGKFVKETDWFSGYPEVVAAAVKRRNSRELLRFIIG